VNPLTLTLRAQPETWLDLSPLTPDGLAGKSATAIGRVRLRTGRRSVPLRELFDVAGGDPEHIRIRGGMSRLAGIGSRMTRGTIEVQGHGGQRLGQGMRGGNVIVRGHAGDQIAAGMTGGTIHIYGDAGDFIGAGLPGATRGMSGGVVAIHGNAGARVADGMRRGLVVVSGNAGELAGSQMQAGTLVILGSAGRHPGYGMRRGTIILGGPAELLPTFRSCGQLEMDFLRLLFRQAASADARLELLRRLPATVHRYAGDSAAGGTGEVLVLSRASRR